MRFLLLSFCLFSGFALSAQFSIDPPVVATGPYAITDTVYMSPDGDDANPGTQDQPVQSFAKALQLLPFGTPGVNGGQAYGLIRLLPGTYVSANGFQQGANQWKNGNTYKNVSVEGIGEVQIGGTANDFCTGHGLRLLGSHIFVKNITIRYAGIIGLFVHRNSLGDPRPSDVLIENVQVDSVGSFAMLFEHTDRIEVANCRASWAARPGADDLATPCQWPSGIKFLFSTHCRIHHSTIEYTRGEGLNFHSVLNGEAYDNVIHDNGTNIYNDNSKNLIIRHNFIYNTPGAEAVWRNCPADTHPILSPAGMLIANEGACPEGLAPTFQNCTTNCFVTGDLFPNVDSVFIFNNIFQNVGSVILFWEGVTSILGVNCIRNVFVYHNTCISALGDEGAANSRGLIDFFFPAVHNTLTNSNFAIAQNIRISNNIFYRDPDAGPHLPPVRMVRHNLFPVPIDVTFDHNIWPEEHPFMGPNGEVRTLPADLPILLDSLHLIQPCDEQPEWVFAVPETGEIWLGDDYLYEGRNEGLTNAGALEYRADCQEVSSVFSKAEEMGDFRVSPNPLKGNFLHIFSGSQEPLELKLFDLTGSLQGVWHIDSPGGDGVTIQLPNQLRGLYLLELRSGAMRKVIKLVKAD
jgi:hypothetical protein